MPQSTLVMLLAIGCAQNIELLPNVDGLRSPGDGAADGGASCAGLGDPIRLQSGAGPACAAALTAGAHRFALCSCATLSTMQALASDAFDSTGLPGSSQTTAAVGSNGDIAAAAPLTLGGALFVAGAGGSHADAGGQLTESLHVGATFAGSAAKLAVGTDAWIAGDLSGTVDIKGALHIPTANSVGAGVTTTVVSREPVTVVPPCACSGAGLVDVAAEVSAATASNQDAAIGLRAGSLVGTNAPARLDLPCGTYAVDALAPAGPLTLAVHGNTRLVVTGDVTAVDTLAVQLDPGAELDLVVGGTLTLSGGHPFGDPNAAARVRVWIGSSGTVTLANAPTVGATLDAPRATVSAPAGVELFGSVLAAGFSAGGNATFHFDRAVLAGGSICGAAAVAAVH